MEVYQTEEQQAEAIHKFWQNHKKTIISTLIFFTVGFSSFRYYQHHVEARAENASYQSISMYDAMRDKKYDEAKKHANNIVKEFPSTPYAEVASMYLAKIAVENNDLNLAKKHLTWIIDNRSKGPNYHIALVRLARLYRETNDYEKAIELLSKNSNGFTAYYDEVEGDIYLDQNLKEKARNSYDNSLSAAPKTGATPWLQLKIENLTAAKSILDKKPAQESGKQNEES